VYAFKRKLSIAVVPNEYSESELFRKMSISGAVVGAPKAKSKLVTFLLGSFSSSRKEGCVGWDQASNSKNIVVASDSGAVFLAPDA